MGELINGRTPEEIKAALELCNMIAIRKNICESCPYNGECTPKNMPDQPGWDALLYIQHLEAQQPRWISVKERLPEVAGKYIVCTTKKAVYCTAFRFFHGEGYFATDSTTHITHWMYLPQPPKGE